MTRPDATLEERGGTDACVLPDPLERSELGVQRRLTSPLVVAVDGTRASDSALRLASSLASREGAFIDAVLVDGIAPSGSGTRLGARAVRREQLPASTRIGRVRNQLCAALATDCWALDVEFGSFGPTVANVAESIGASLIVMGLSRHRPVRRLLGKGAVARVLQSAQVPVLAVSATARELPHAAVAAIDFSPASLRAAYAARDILERPGTLYLVHVRPANPETITELTGWDAVYREGVMLKLNQLAADLTVEGVNIVPRVQAGPLAETLLVFTMNARADLIACGARSMSPIERLLLGQLPAQLLKDAQCSVLVAPLPEENHEHA